MFHAFLKKAEASNNTFEEILGNVQDVALEEEPPDQDVKDQYIEMHGISGNLEDDELEYIIEEAFKSPKDEPSHERPQKAIGHEITVADESSAVDEQDGSEHYDANDGNESKSIHTRTHEPKSEQMAFIHIPFCRRIFGGVFGIR